MTKHTAPATVIAPWVGTNASAAKNAKASSISSAPAALIGRTWSPKRPRISEIAPTVPGKIRPGFQSSTISPSVPSDMNRTIRFGSISVSRAFCQRDMSTFVISASFVCRTMPFGHGLRPVDLVQQRGQRRRHGVDHVPLERLRRAEVRGLGAPRQSAHSTFRPCERASSRSEAAASLTTLRRRSDWMFPPPTSIGVDEPMFVFGAMARRSAAWPIQTPAEAARAPGGET